MEKRKRILSGSRRREESVGGEWLRFLFCLTVTLVVGILLRTGILQNDVVEKALLDHAPQVSWRDHAMETLARVGELFYGKSELSG